LEDVGGMMSRGGTSGFVVFFFFFFSLFFFCFFCLFAEGLAGEDIPFGLDAKMWSISDMGLEKKKKEMARD